MFFPFSNRNESLIRLYLSGFCNDWHLWFTCSIPEYICIENECIDGRGLNAADIFNLLISKNVPLKQLNYHYICSGSVCCHPARTRAPEENETNYMLWENGLIANALCSLRLSARPYPGYVYSYNGCSYIAWQRKRQRAAVIIFIQFNG